MEEQNNIFKGKTPYGESANTAPADPEPIEESKVAKTEDDTEEGEK